MDNPDGNEGDTDHEVMVPPFAVGVTAVIAVPLVRVNVFGLYASEDGASSITSMVKTTLSLPPVLLPVTV